EYALPLLGGNPWAGVLHIEHCAAFIGPDFDDDPAAWECVADRVVDEIACQGVKRLLLPNCAGGFHTPEPQVDRFRFGERPELGHDARGKPVEIERGGLLKGCLRREPRHGQHLLDEARCASRTGLQLFERIMELLLGSRALHELYLLPESVTRL